MKLSYTRSMVKAALSGELDGAEYVDDPIFKVAVPRSVPGVPSEVLDPRNTWADKAAYERKAKELAQKFSDNFEKFAKTATPEILASAPNAV
jgi:phosphoenolpyruvate carboxykinase (ATP)